MSAYAEDAEPVAKAAIEEMSVQLVFLSGELAWGPQPVNLSTTVGDLIQKVAEHIGKPSIAIHLLHCDHRRNSNKIHLLHETTILDTEAALSSLGVASQAGPITLQCSIGAMLAETQSMFDKFLVFLFVLNGSQPGISKSLAVARSEIDAEMEKISAAAGLDFLPADVFAWLQVLLCTGKTFCDHRDGFVFDPFQFLMGSEFGGMPGTRGGVAAGGLIYLSIFDARWDDDDDNDFDAQWDDDDNGILCWIIDAGGELARMNGEEGVGAVYLADTGPFCEPYECGRLFTAADWKSLHPGMVETRPTRVADCLTDLFAAWMANGGIPGGARGK